MYALHRPRRRPLLLALLLAVGLAGCTDTALRDGLRQEVAAPPDLPAAGQSYAHRVMAQVGFAFADVAVPQGAPAWSTVFGFLPAEAAADAETARRTFDGMVIDALAEALRRADLGTHGVRPEPLVLDQTGGAPVASLRFDITGPPCDTDGTRCAYMAPVLDLPTRAEAPAASGVQGQAWWVGSRWFGPAVRDAVAGPQPLFNDLPLWQDVSAALPDWAFVYLARGTVTVVDPATGGRSLNAWPLLVHDGCVYRFGPRGAPVRKQPEARVAAR